MDEKASKTRLLITGATGFVGSALAKYFYAQGFQIRALTRNLTHPIVQQNPQYKWICADLTVTDSLTHVCDNIDYVFHAAGFAHASKNNNASFEEKHHLMNYQATVNLAKITSSSHVKRFIYFSTVKACADAQHCVDETYHDYPADAYGLSKRLAEEKLLMLSTITSMDVVILRLSLVYGVGWKGNLASMLKAIDKNWFPPVPVVNNQKSMVSIHDVCAAAKCAAFSELKSNRIFIVTDGFNYSTYVIYQLMRTALGKQKQRWTMPIGLWKFFGKLGDIFQKITRREFPIHSEAVEKLFGNAQYHSLYAENEIGFVPKFTFESVLPEIIALYKDFLR